MKPNYVASTKARCTLCCLQCCVCGHHGTDSARPVIQLQSALFQLEPKPSTEPTMNNGHTKLSSVQRALQKTSGNLWTTTMLFNKPVHLKVSLKLTRQGNLLPVATQGLSSSTPGETKGQHVNIHTQKKGLGEPNLSWWYVSLKLKKSKKGNKKTKF